MLLLDRKGKSSLLLFVFREMNTICEAMKSSSGNTNDDFAFVKRLSQVLPCVAFVTCRP